MQEFNLSMPFPFLYNFDITLSFWVNINKIWIHYKLGVQAMDWMSSDQYQLQNNNNDSGRTVRK